MNVIEQLKYEIEMQKRELETRKRIFLKECEKESEMLQKMDRWLDYIVKEQKEAANDTAGTKR